MSSNSEVLTGVGDDFVLKVARVVPGAICYGIYFILMAFIISIFARRGFKARGSNLFLLTVTSLMFLGGTIFLSLDVTDLVRRMQIILVNHPEQDIQGKLDVANERLKKMVWTGEMLFVFMLILGDSVVVWRTWIVCFGLRKLVAIPMATWLGSLIAGLFELGCDVHTHWAINDLTPSAASVGAEVCAHADLSSYTLSYVTNIFCTLIIAFRTWQHRRAMSTYLGQARRKTQVEKILTLIIESGFIYIVIYTLQAVPIYGAKLNSAGLTAFNVVNAIIQQALGIYPTVIIVLVKMQKSLWDTKELSAAVHSRSMQFATARSEVVSDTVVGSSRLHSQQTDTRASASLSIEGRTEKKRSSSDGFQGKAESEKQTEAERAAAAAFEERRSHEVP